MIWSLFRDAGMIYALTLGILIEVSGDDIASYLDLSRYEDLDADHELRVSRHSVLSILLVSPQNRLH